MWIAKSEEKEAKWPQLLDRDDHYWVESQFLKVYHLLLSLSARFRRQKLNQINTANFSPLNKCHVYSIKCTQWTAQVLKAWLRGTEPWQLWLHQWINNRWLVGARGSRSLKSALKRLFLLFLPLSLCFLDAAWVNSLLQPGSSACMLLLIQTMLSTLRLMTTDILS